MSYSIQCVHCKAVLKSKAPVPAGKTVTCPKCKQLFVTPDEGHTTKFEKTTSFDQPAAAAEPSSLPDDEMEAAIAKLQAEQAGTKPAPPPKPTIPNMEIPDTGDEMVEPEPEEVEPEALVEASPAKNRRAEAGPKRDRREEDDDEPRSRRKRRDEDEEEDDEPRSRRKRADEEEDDDEDDEPRSRRKRREKEEEDDDEDDRPRSRKRKKSGGGALLWILLAGGGVFGLLACCGAGIGGYFLLGIGSPNIVGRWENKEMLPVIYEFRADSTGKLEALGTETIFDYRLSGSNLTITPTRVKAFGMDMQVPFKESTPIRVRRQGDTLHMEGLEGRRAVMVLRKIN